MGATGKHMILRGGHEGECTELIEMNCYEKGEARMVSKFLVWGNWVGGN